MRWLNKLERKYGKYAISGLMTYIVGITGFVTFMSFMNFPIVGKITLERGLVMQGQVWRLITYIFTPPSASPIWIAFVLYFYYMIGSSLESVWGSFRFNFYYLLGMLGTTIAVFATGESGTALYLNLSLFLAYAHLFPDEQILLFFVLPVKVKYLGWLDWAFLIITAVTAAASGSIGGAIVVLIPVLNFFVFFFEDFVHYSKKNRMVQKNRKKFRAQVIELDKARTIHKCTICGITEKDDPKMEFRYCTECDGYREYCMEHLKTHEHIKDGSVRD